jgi:hypothetical protein
MSTSCYRAEGRTQKEPGKEEGGEAEQRSNVQCSDHVVLIVSKEMLSRAAIDDGRAQSRINNIHTHVKRTQLKCSNITMQMKWPSCLL